MPRYTSKATGVVVNIPAELAERLGGYMPVEVKESPRHSRKSSKSD